MLSFPQVSRNLLVPILSLGSLGLSNANGAETPPLSEPPIAPANLGLLAVNATNKTSRLSVELLCDRVQEMLERINDPYIQARIFITVSPKTLGKERIEAIAKILLDAEEPAWKKSARSEKLLDLECARFPAASFQLLPGSYGVNASFDPEGRRFTQISLLPISSQQMIQDRKKTIPSNLYSEAFSQEQAVGLKLVGQFDAKANSGPQAKAVTLTILGLFEN